MSTWKFEVVWTAPEVLWGNEEGDGEHLPGGHPANHAHNPDPLGLQDACGEHVEHVGLVYLPSSKVAYFRYHWVLGFHRRLLWKRSPARFVILSFKRKAPSNQQRSCHLPWVPFLFPRNAENPCCLLLGLGRLSRRTVSQLLWTSLLKTVSNDRFIWACEQYCQTWEGWPERPQTDLMVFWGSIALDTMSSWALSSTTTCVAAKCLWP